MVGDRSPIGVRQAEAKDDRRLLVVDCNRSAITLRSRYDLSTIKRNCSAVTCCKCNCLALCFLHLRPLYDHWSQAISTQHFHLNKLESPPPIDATCQILRLLDSRFLRRRFFLNLSKKYPFWGPSWLLKGAGPHHL